MSRESRLPLPNELNDAYAYLQSARSADQSVGLPATLDEVDVTGVEPMTSVTPIAMKKREDKVTDGQKADDIVANAPATDRNFFQVPKVVE